MKYLSMLLVFTAAVIALSLPVRGAELEEALGVEMVEDALPQSAKDALGQQEVSTDVRSGLEKLWHYAADKLTGIVKEVLLPVTEISAVAALCAAASGLVTDQRGIDYVNLGGCLAIASISLKDVNSLMAVGERTLAELSDFSKALLPTLSASAVAAGAVSSAPGKYAVTALFLDVLINAANTLVFPVVCAYTAAVLAECCIGDQRLSGAVKLLKWVCGFLLAALVTAFTLYMSLTGVIAASTDALTTKAAKTAISAALPIVGGIVSDAAGSIVAGAGLIRNAVGVFGLLAVLGVCLLPFARLGIRYLFFKAAAVLAQAVSGERLGRLIGGIGATFGMILSIVGVEALFLYISVISMIRTVSP